MRMITVCVDFADLLAISLPYNARHFSERIVITSYGDKATQEVCQQHSVQYFTTDSFYDAGAKFNKWKALERGLDAFGRHGWMCIMDVDILWPKNVIHQYEPGCLYTPYRRMMYDLSQPVPSDSDWAQRFELHPQQREFAGYSQIFHADDPALGPAPWHQVDWAHAGGADSFFQMKWPARKKIRPGWECLHLGESGQNWCGRTTPRLDGIPIQEASARKAALDDYMRMRQATGNFNHERL